MLDKQPPLAPRTFFSPIAVMTVLVLLVGVLLRVLFLDADPHYYAWIGYITDEGRWVYHARSYFLFKSIPRDGVYDLHVVLAPLFEGANYLFFSLAGFNQAATRLLSALCGSALLVVFWRQLRAVAAPAALLVGVVLLAIQVDFVELSRVAVPEMPIVFCEAVIYFLLVSRVAPTQWMWIPGMLTLLALGMKATAAPVFPIFSAIALAVPLAGPNAAPLGRWRRLFWFWLGFGAPVVLPAIVGIACCVPHPVWSLGRLSGGLISTLAGFLGLADVYNIIGFPVNHPFALTFNTLALGLWLAWLGWEASAPEDTNEASRRYLMTSAIWVAMYAAVMLALEYFPQRYMAHIVLPMAVNITVGISLLHKAGMSRVVAAFERTDAHASWPRTMMLIAPTAVFAAPLLAQLVEDMGRDPEGLRVRLACVAASAVLFIALVGRFKLNRGLIAFLVAFPVVAEALWLIARTTSVPGGLFWPTLTDATSIRLLVGALTAAALSVVLFLKRPEALSVGRLTAVYVTGYVVASLVRLVPGYLEPHYTIRDISRELGATLQGASVATSKGEGLFNDNRLPYRRFDLRDLGVHPPDAVVTVFETPDVLHNLKGHYHLAKTYTAYVAPEYRHVEPLPEPLQVSVWKRDQ